MGFFSNLTGGKSSNRYLQGANDDLDAAFGTYESQVKPFAQSGRQSNIRLGNLYGLNGAPAQAASYNTFSQSPLAQKLGLGDFRTSPGYQFQLQQGLNAIDSSAASKGLLNSGATMKAAQEYGQGLADQELDDWANRLTSAYGDFTGGLAGLTNTGANAASGIGNARLTTTGATAANTAQIGANKTAGANGIAGLIGGGLSALQKAYTGGM